MNTNIKNEIAVETISIEEMKEKQDLSKKVLINDIISLLITFIYFVPIAGDTFAIIKALTPANFLSKLPKLLINITFCTMPFKKVSKMINKK